MAINRRQGHKVIKSVRTEDASGVRMDSGPFVGIVKHVLDPTRSGRLQVYLPHLGGDPENPNNQVIVQYASPFSGHTSYQTNPNRDINTKFEFETVRHSYGMWFTPPDIGVRVLVIFEASNANNGYWIACLPPVVEHNQLGSSGGVTKDKVLPDPQVNALLDGYQPDFVPVVEINAANLGSVANQRPFEVKKPPHRIQTKILAEQGLLADPDRGIDDASTIRETPSGAFGITTPGRTYVDQATDDLLQRVSLNPNVDLSKIKEKVDTGRKGGHQFIMDDGDVNGFSRRMKLRTAAGNQIILDDTSGFIYIANSTGKVWLEFSNDGQVTWYAGADITIRTEGNLNIKVDGDMNTEVNGDYNLKVRGDIKTEAINREEVLTGNKDIDITGRYHKTVTGSMQIDVLSNYSLAVSDDIAIDSTAAIGIKSANDTNVQAGGGIGMASGASMNFLSASPSGWKAGGDLNFEAPAINLNSGPPGSPASPSAVIAPTVPAPFTLTDLLDTGKIGDIWKHDTASTSTAQTIMPKITTHEPYGSAAVIPLVSSTGKPSKGV